MLLIWPTVLRRERRLRERQRILFSQTAKWTAQIEQQITSLARESVRTARTVMSEPVELVELELSVRACGGCTLALPADEAPLSSEDALPLLFKLDDATAAFATEAAIAACVGVITVEASPPGEDGFECGLGALVGVEAHDEPGEDNAADGGEVCTLRLLLLVAAGSWLMPFAAFAAASIAAAAEACCPFSVSR